MENHLDKVAPDIVNAIRLNRGGHVALDRCYLLYEGTDPEGAFYGWYQIGCNDQFYLMSAVLTHFAEEFDRLTAESEHPSDG